MAPPTEDRGSGSTDTEAQDTGVQVSGAKDITIFAETGGKWRESGDVFENFEVKTSFLKHVIHGFYFIQI